MTATQVESRWGPIVSQYNSTRTPEIVYDVRYKGGKYSCNCPGWRFRKSCRHVRHAQENNITDAAPTYEMPWEEKVLEEVLAAAAVLVNKTAQQRMLTVLKKYLGHPKPEATMPAPTTGAIRMFTFD